MKWLITYVNGRSIPVSASNERTARELANKRGRALLLSWKIASIKPDANEIRGKTTYVVINEARPKYRLEGQRLLSEPNVAFEGGLLRCVEYTRKNSGRIDDIRAKSSKGRLRYLTAAEKLKAHKLG